VWFAQGEQSAGRWRLKFMWLAYVCLGKGFLKALCVPVMAFIYPFARPAKAALREYYRVLAAFRPDGAPRPTAWTLFRHLLGFAWSLADKTDACSLKKSLPRMAVRDDAGFRAFRDCLAAGHGAFVMTSHVGTAEDLPALPLVCRDLPRAPHVHAFQQMAHDAVFTEVFMRRFDASALTLHAVEDIGVETAGEMKAAIARGELVMMAGDRVSAGSAKTLEERFLGVDCAWPKGVFAFARLMEAPVFFVTCVRVGWNAYEAHFAAAPAAGGRGATAGMLAAYAGFLEGEVLAHPLEWHQFYDFFKPRIQNN
jgi:predicted LPLAT superfamily acyltransferase